MQSLLRPCSRLLAPGVSTAQLQNLRCFAAGASQQLAVIKELRERSGAPISDVKSALVEAEWDVDKAFDGLRKKGLAAATKKASRHAAEGLIGLSQGPTGAALVEVNSETDFVARNPQFVQLVGSVALAALQCGASGAGSCEVDMAVLRQARLQDGTSVDDAVVGVAAAVRENVVLRRAAALAAGPGAVVGTYLHTSAAPGTGRMAAAVALQAPGGVPEEAQAEVAELAGKVAMHCVATRPAYLDRGAVPQAALEAEKAVLRDQAKTSGKPDNIIDKMVMGRLGKFYEEQCLVEQKYVMAEDAKVQDVVKAAGKQLGVSGLEVKGFVRLQVGEGLDRTSKDFAAEVAEAVQGAA